MNVTLNIEVFIRSQVEVADVQWPDAPERNPNASYSGTIHAVSDVVRLVAELHQPLVVAGAAATASATAFGAKIGSALGEAVTEWFKARIKGRPEVKATILAPDGSVLKEIKGR